MADGNEVIGFAAFIQFVAGSFLLVLCGEPVVKIHEYPLLSLVVGLHIWTCGSGIVVLLSRSTSSKRIRIFFCCSSFASAALAATSFFVIFVFIEFGGYSIWGGITCVIELLVEAWIIFKIYHHVRCNTGPQQQASRGTPVAVPIRGGSGTAGIQTIPPGQRKNNAKRSRILSLKQWMIHQFRQKPVPQASRGALVAVPTRRGGGIQTLIRGRRTNNTKRSRLLILKRRIIRHVRRKPVPQVTKLCRSSASFLIQAEGGIGEIQTATPRTKKNQPQTVLPSDSKTVDDPLPPSVADASGFQTVLAQLPRSDAFVPIEAGGGTVKFQIAAPGAQDREDQPHSLVQLPNSSEVGNPPPSYEAVASSYQTVEVDLAPSVASVPTQADDVTVEVQTVTLRAQEHDEQHQIVVIPDSSSGLNNPPPPYEAVAPGFQTFRVDVPPSYDEALHCETMV